MAAFATHADLVARWRPLSSDEINRATVLLGDASEELRVRAPGIDARITAYKTDPTDVTGLNPDIAKRIVCAMVKRVMLAGSEREGLSTYQEATGPFSESVTFQNPNGDLFLTKAERQLLGVGGQQAFSINPTPASS